MTYPKRELLAVLALMCGGLLGALPATGLEHQVAVVGSDSPALEQRVPRDQPLSTVAVSGMVRHAVDLIGGMASVVPDTARLVIIKPNIAIISAPETGIVTDPRVVAALAQLVHEVAPAARILIAEGAGGWQGPPPGEQWFGARLIREVLNGAFANGFETGRYEDVAAELRPF